MPHRAQGLLIAVRFFVRLQTEPGQCSSVVGPPPPTAGHTCRRTLGSAFGPVSRQYLVFASVDVPSGGQAKQEQGSCHLPAFHPPDFCQTVKEKFAAGTDNAEASQTLACGQ